MKLTRRTLLQSGAATALLPALPAFAQDKPLLAFVTNASADFQTIARRGTEKAQGALPDFQVEFIVPAEPTRAEQRQIIDDLLARGMKALAISPVNPENATEKLNRAAAAVLFASDSEAPASNRMV